MTADRAVTDWVTVRLSAALCSMTPASWCRLDVGGHEVRIGAQPGAQISIEEYRAAVIKAVRSSQVPRSLRWLTEVQAVAVGDVWRSPTDLHWFAWDGTPVWSFATALRPATTAQVVRASLCRATAALRGTREVDDLELVADDQLGVTVVLYLDDEPDSPAEPLARLGVEACVAYAGSDTAPASSTS